MRPKFVLKVMVLAALVLTAAFYIKLHVAPLQPPTDSETASLPVVSNSTGRFMTVRRPVIAPAIASSAMTPEQRQAYIEDEISRLFDLSTQHDPASLTAILNELANPEKKVRLAAIEAVKQFGSRDAIPALKAGVANATDTDEQIALLEAAEFLSLPTIADADVQLPKTPEQIQAAQQRRVQAAARRQALLQQRAQIQSLQSPPDPNSQPGPNN